MGITIHYRGKLHSPDLMPQVRREIEDICQANGWKYSLFTDESPMGDSSTETDEPSPLQMLRDIFDGNQNGENDDDNDDDDHDDDSDDDDEDDNNLGENDDNNEFTPENVEKFDIGLRGISFRPGEKAETVDFLFDSEGYLQSPMSIIMSVSNRLKYHWMSVETQGAGVETHIRLINLFSYLKKKYFKKLDIKDSGDYYPRKNKETLQTRFDYVDNTLNTIRDIFENAEFEGSPDEVMEQMREALTKSLKGATVKIIKVGFDEIIDNSISPNDDTSDNPPNQTRQWDDDSFYEEDENDAELPF